MNNKQMKRLALQVKKQKRLDEQEKERRDYIVAFMQEAGDMSKEDATELYRKKKTEREVLHDGFKAFGVMVAALVGMAVIVFGLVLIIQVLAIVLGVV